MSQSWLVTVEGQAYGPYPYEQMQTFIAEGRIVAHSLVETPEDAAPHPASQDPVLGVLFQPAAAPAAEPVSAAETFVPAESAPTQKFGRQADAGDGELAHFIIIADMKSRSINGLEEEIFNLGHAYPMMPQVWVLKSDQAVNAVRNALVQRLGKLDTLFVVDTTHDKAAWFNFGPEADARIRRVWSKPSSERKSA